MIAKKPLIGVTTSKHKGQFMWWCTKAGIKLAGGNAIRIFDSNHKSYNICDGYIISGGGDVNPACYGEENTTSAEIDLKRDKLEEEVIAHALQYKKPLMGICRGAQMINIIQGGTLYQDAQKFYETFVPSDNLIHKMFSRKLINITNRGVIHNLFNKKTKIFVNSLHHQAICQLGKNLIIVAKDEHGIIQAIESECPKNTFIIGVQWHPEFMLHKKPHRDLFKILVMACYDKNHYRCV